MAVNNKYPTGLLTINTRVVVSNWALLKDKVTSLNPFAQCAAVVKADAYGLGVKPVAQALLSAGCEIFFVATLVEGIELRECLGKEPSIFVLGGVSHSLGREWEEYKLSPLIFDVADLTHWLSLGMDKKVPYALKIDTGMHRLGVSLTEFQQLIDDHFFQRCKPPSLLLSHLACSDEEMNPINDQQCLMFSNIVKSFSAEYKNTKFSLANSSGIFLGKSFHFDLVRPGVALYGANPTPSEANPMSAVVKLELPVMQLKTVPPGSPVGYNATFTTARETRLATVFGGYADGLMRSLSNLGKVSVNGNLAPIVGRVSMDSMMVDVTDLPSDCLSNLRYVEVIGERMDISALARAASTSAYEILTSLGHRYQRNYI